MKGLADGDAEDGEGVLEASVNGWAATPGHTEIDGLCLRSKFM